MFGNYNAKSAYQKTGVDAAVITADPHKLILLLFDGAELAISAAKGHIEQGNIAGKGESIGKAVDIIDNGLKSCLDLKNGGEIAGKLEALYEYMVLRLSQANLKNNVAALDEVLGLLKEIHSAWAEIGKTPNDGG